MQADRTTPWSGMDHDAGAPTWWGWELTRGVPARLEVTIDPAAHGPGAVGSVARGVALTTAGRQQLQFTLTATVTAG